MDLTELFCDVDDFVKRYNRTNNLQIEDSKFKRSINCRLSASEIMTIYIAYHQSGYKNFKAFYLNYVIPHLKRQFPTIVSYNRFIELMPKVTVLLSAYLVIKFSKVTGISFVDSTPIQICKLKRMSRNKVFKDVAAKAKSTIGWFFLV